MIEGISSAQFGGGMNMPRFNYEMTDEDKETFADIIEKYDSANMTKEDTESLRSELKDAGIKPGEDLKNMMQEAGFDMPGPPPGKGTPPQGAGMMAQNSETSETLNNFIEKFKSGTADEEDLDSLLSWINQNNLSYNGNIIDENS